MYCQVFQSLNWLSEAVLGFAFTFYLEVVFDLQKREPF